MQVSLSWKIKTEEFKVFQPLLYKLKDFEGLELFVVYLSTFKVKFRTSPRKKVVSYDRIV